MLTNIDITKKGQKNRYASGIQFQYSINQKLQVLLNSEHIVESPVSANTKITIGNSETKTLGWLAYCIRRGTISGIPESNVLMNACNFPFGIIYAGNTTYSIKKVQAGMIRITRF